MAGNYPDVPGPRMALDLDGSQMYWINSTGLVTQISNATVATINDETAGVGSGGGQGTNFLGYLMVYFPEKRDVVGYWLSYGDGSLLNGNAAPTSAQVSTDTTNGFDGTWTTVTLASSVGGISPAYRTAIQVISAPGIKAMRWGFNTGVAGSVSPTLHVFGTPTAGENPNRLRMWHPTLDQELTGAYFDWGNVPRSSSADRTFRVKNQSATLSANTITVGVGAPTDTSPSVAGQHLLSSDGVTFGASASAGTLAPGAISGVLTLRRVTPSNAVLSLWAARLIATAASWT